MCFRSSCHSFDHGLDTLGRRRTVTFVDYCYTLYRSSHIPIPLKVTIIIVTKFMVDFVFKAFQYHLDLFKLLFLCSIYSINHIQVNKYSRKLLQRC